MKKLITVAEEVCEAGKTIQTILEHGQEIGEMLDFEEDGGEDDGEEVEDGEEGEDGEDNEENEDGEE